MAWSVEPPTLEAVKKLGSYPSLCGTWWDANCTHDPSPPAKAPVATPTWRACGSVRGPQVAEGEKPTCGGCQQLRRMELERERMRAVERKHQWEIFNKLLTTKLNRPDACMLLFPALQDFVSATLSGSE